MREITIDPLGVEADVTWLDAATIRVAWLVRPACGLTVADYDAVTLERRAIVRTVPPQVVFPRVAGNLLAYKTAPGWGVTLEAPIGTVALETPGPAATNEPCDLSDSGEYFAYTDASQAVHLLLVATLSDMGSPTPGDATGIEQVTDAGTVVLRSAIYGTVPGMASVHRTADFLVGENTDSHLGDKGAVVRAGAKQTLLFAGRYAEMPRGALLGESLAVVAGIAQGCFLGVITKADLTQEVPPPPEPPVPPEPPKPKDGFYALCCWGAQETLATYQTLVGPEHGFEAVRLECRHLTDETQLYQAIRTVQLANLRPVAILEPRQVVNGCPRFIDVEYLNEADIGCPPTPKLSPSQYAALVMSHYQDAKAKGLRQWTGGISNISPNALAWLRAVLSLLPADIGVAYHRYPPKWDAQVTDPRPEYRTRAAEMAALKTAAGDRPLICTEFGWDYARHKTGWWIFGSWKSLSEVEVAQRTRNEWAYLKANGIQAGCLYQINDPPAPQPAEFGCRASSGRWKPASVVHP